VADANRPIPEKETAYPAGRMFGRLSAYGLFCRHVTNLCLENVDVRFTDDDARPAFVLDDVRDARLLGCRGQVGPQTPWLVWLKNVDRATLTGWCPASGNVFLRVAGPATRRIVLFGNDLGDVALPWKLGPGVPANAVRALQNVGQD